MKGLQPPCLSPSALGAKLAPSPGMTTPVQFPPEFDELPEPGRTKALEFLQELLDAGQSQRDAVQQARQRAEHWITERVKAAH